MTTKASILIQARLAAASLIALALFSAATAGATAVVIQADFGGAVMPGVVYGVSSELDIFTIQPLIPLYDIDAASRSLAYTAPYWPAGTVFVSVVDPGVGTPRKSVVLKTRSGHYFVSPDNGSLTDVAENLGIEAVREIDESVNRLKGSERSHTFHGRDVYSYTAARLAAGVIGYDQVGPLLAPQVVRLERPEATLKDGVVSGTIASSGGRFGNVSSNIKNTLFDQLGVREGEIVIVTIRNRGELVWEQQVPYVRTFGAVPLGEPLLFVNSSYFLSLAINQGQFAAVHQIGSGPDWRIEIRAKPAPAPSP
ncbi:MAG TPA: SAM-dependent chlorinase/fluorinase [Acidobacteriota bacterium]